MIFLVILSWLQAALRVVNQGVRLMQNKSAYGQTRITTLTPAPAKRPRLQAWFTTYRI